VPTKTQIGQLYPSEQQGRIKIMKVSLDGGETFVEAPNGVRVIFDDIDLDSEVEGEGQIHINHTCEGIITDVIKGDRIICTKSETLDDLMYPRG